MHANNKCSNETILRRFRHQRAGIRPALAQRCLTDSCFALLDHILDRTIIPVYNEEILNEYNEVLHRSKFSFASEQINAVLAAIRSGIAADRTPANWNFPDEEDIVFYEVALSVDEAHLITGNTRHFPPVSKVVTPAEMLRIVKGNV